MSEVILFLIVIFAIVCGCYKTYSDFKWNLKPIDNFRFYYRGNEFWYSRAVATSPFVFCKNKEDKWCVLANKRGEGTLDYQGYWNVPCGYLAFGVDGEENCVKEIFEECGVSIEKEKLKLFSVNTNPSENKQNVSLRYIAMLDGTIDNFSLTNENSEKNEVSDIKWIPLDEIDNYQWAFNHLNIIKEIKKSNFGILN